MYGQPEQICMPHQLPFFICQRTLEQGPKTWYWNIQSYLIWRRVKKTEKSNPNKAQIPLYVFQTVWSCFKWNRYDFRVHSSVIFFIVIKHMWKKCKILRPSARYSSESKVWVMLHRLLASTSSPNLLTGLYQLWPLNNPYKNTDKLVCIRCSCTLWLTQVDGGTLEHLSES